MRKLLLFVCMLCLSTTVFSQLYVKPTAAAQDSYVYVNDDVLFVTGAIDLTINPTAATEASIYLRGDAQLIQGTTGNSTNTGTGVISVYQQGFADRYEYNYWSSPVGNASTAIGNENFGVTMLYDVVNNTNSTQANNTDGYDGTSSPLTISNRWVWKFITGTVYAEWIYVGNTSTVGPGQGFTMKGVDLGADEASTPRQEYDFRGKPNDGNIDNPVIDNELTLVGNPYPSAVDMRAYLQANTNIEATAFYWEQDHTVNSHYLRAYEGGYATWQPGSTTAGDYQQAIFLNYGGDGTDGPPTGAGGTLLIERRYAPIGQGFMVRGAIDGNVTMRNSYRVDVKEGAGNLSEFKSAPYFTENIDPIGVDSPEVVSRRQLLKLNIFINDFEAAGLSLFFHDKATNGLDRGLDALSPRSTAKDVYWSIEDDPEDENYVMQTVPFDPQAMIPITFTADEYTDFRIYISDEQNINEDIYLYDSVEDTYQLMSKEDYTIQTLDPGTYKDRFYITFQKEDNPETTASMKLESLVTVFQNNPIKQLEIHNPEGLDIAQATLVDMSGKVIWTKANLGNSRIYSYPTGILSDGIYMLQLKASDNSTTVEKVRIINR
ncbi:MAG: T9SS type A sorting domain-containing protein [Gilvibacter sp.]